MANPNLTMPKLKRAFQLLAAIVLQRTIYEQLHMSRGVLSKYKQAADLTHNRYLTIWHLHERYLQIYPDGYGYTQFKKAIRDYQYAQNLSYLIASV